MPAEPIAAVVADLRSTGSDPAFRADLAVRIVAALAVADPIYDCYRCFFCAALAPIPAADRGPAWTDQSEQHEPMCPWWMARQALGLSDWPTDEEREN